MPGVVEFPRSERMRTPAEAIAEASGQNYDEIVVLGLTKSGMEILHSEMTAAEMLWLLEQAKKILLADD